MKKFENYVPHEAAELIIFERLQSYLERNTAQVISIMRILVQYEPKIEAFKLITMVNALMDEASND